MKLGWIILILLIIFWFLFYCNYISRNLKEIYFYLVKNYEKEKPNISFGSYFWINIVIGFITLPFFSIIDLFIKKK